MTLTQFCLLFKGRIERGIFWLYFAVAICLLTNVACQKQLSTSEIMNTWIGHHISEAIRSWGPYQQAIPDGKGGMVYSWQSSTQMTTPVFGVMLSKTVVYEKTFYVRSDGIIYSWHTRGYE